MQFCTTTQLSAALALAGAGNVFAKNQIGPILTKFKVIETAFIDGDTASKYPDKDLIVTLASDGT